jgi:hypothetical protein
MYLRHCVRENTGASLCTKTIERNVKSSVGVSTVPCEKLLNQAGALASNQAASFARGAQIA